LCSKGIREKSFFYWVFQYNYFVLGGALITHVNNHAHEMTMLKRFVIALHDGSSHGYISKRDFLLEL